MKPRRRETPRRSRLRRLPSRWRVEARLPHQVAPRRRGGPRRPTVARPGQCRWPVRATQAHRAASPRLWERRAANPPRLSPVLPAVILVHPALRAGRHYPGRVIQRPVAVLGGVIPVHLAARAGSLGPVIRRPAVLGGVILVLPGAAAHRGALVFQAVAARRQVILGTPLGCLAPQAVRRLGVTPAAHRVIRVGPAVAVGPVRVTPVLPVAPRCPVCPVCPGRLIPAVLVARREACGAAHTPAQVAGPTGQEPAHRVRRACLGDQTAREWEWGSAPTNRLTSNTPPRP
jgi:hypothetical protein